MGPDQEIDRIIGTGLGEGPLWHRLLLPALIAVIVAASTGTASFFGSKVVTGAEQQAALSTQVTELNKTMDRLAGKLDGIVDHLSGLYTRAEAQNDRAESRSHFEALDRRVDDLQRRIDLVQQSLPPQQQQPRWSR